MFCEPIWLLDTMSHYGLDSILNYWHFSARLTAAGFKTVITIDDVMTELGIIPPPPLVSFVYQHVTEKNDAKLWQRFSTALTQTNTILATSDRSWDRLRGLMNSKNEAEFETLRNTFRQSIISSWKPRNTEVARALYALLKKVGDGKSIAENTRFDPNLFPEVID